MKRIPVKKTRISALLLAALLSLCCAAPAEGGTVIVSVGDSYSSGEGVEPFYGQDADMLSRSRNPDWLAHRSEKSWPGRLTLPAVDGPMREHRGTNWFFAAASGAKAEHLFLLTEEETAAGKTAQQARNYDREGVSGTGMLAPQLDIFDELDAKGLKADYVTVTIGGNDIGFQATMIESYFGVTAGLEGETPAEKAEFLMESRYYSAGVREKIKRAYTDTAARAGSQAWIIAAGYPCPLAPEGSGGDAFPPESAQIMNAAAVILNRELEDIAAECRREGIRIVFVSVREAFEGHGAYSDDPYITPVTVGALPQDLKAFRLGSYYSIHPNEKGIAVYARCVQEAIDRLESGN